MGNSKRTQLGALIVLLTLGAPTASAEKFVQVLHQGRDTSGKIVSYYRDVTSVAQLRGLHMESDADCENGYIEWTDMKDHTPRWEYKEDICERWEKLVDFLEDDDEYLFTMKWVPLDEQ
ncbi:MAG: hypothetical protein ACPHTD_01405 [Gammaproteobacteria bacterium]|jgi:hypothetical protein